MKLKLWYPAKPYVVTQRWGIYNPVYEQFGFSKHNGEDFRLGKDKKLRAPIPLKVVEVGNKPNGAGIFVRMISQDMWEVNGMTVWVEVMFMHCESVSVVKGQRVNTGDVVAIADNTGFSTGPHTHGLYRRLSSSYEDTEKTRLDIDPQSNYTFDPAPFWNGFYAEDYGVILSTYEKILDLAKQLLKAKMKGV